MSEITIITGSAVTLPVNIYPLTDDTDFKTRETAVAYNAAGMDLTWNFVTAAGVQTQTAVTPTTSGVYDWSHVGDGIYKIEMPASGGASINNNAAGYGWFTGIATGVLPWRGPIIEFTAATTSELVQDVIDIVDAPDIGLRQIMEKLLYGVAANIVNDKGNYSLSTDTILSFWETLTVDGDDVTGSFGKAFVDLVASMAALPTAATIRDAIFARTYHSKMGSFTFEEISAFTLLAVSGKLTGANTTTSSIRNITDAATAISVTTDATGRTAVSYTIGSVHA